MNIEASINLLEWANLNKLYIETYNECDYHNIYKAIETLLTAYEKEKEKNKNKDKILQNIREEFLKYDWKNANPIQTYNQVKSLYESIYCELYED